MNRKKLKKIVKQILECEQLARSPELDKKAEAEKKMATIVSSLTLDELIKIDDYIIGNRLLTK